MFRTGAVILILALLAGCATTPASAIKPKEPQGELFRINHFNPVTGEAINEKA